MCRCEGESVVKDLSCRTELSLTGSHVRGQNILCPSFLCQSLYVKRDRRNGSGSSRLNRNVNVNSQSNCEQQSTIGNFNRRGKDQGSTPRVQTYKFESAHPALPARHRSDRNGSLPVEYFTHVLIQRSAQTATTSLLIIVSYNMLFPDFAILTTCQ